MSETESSPDVFWEKHYQAMSPVSSGVPGKILVRFTEALTPGKALELGCGRGDDAVWLAQKGWQVTAVDLAYQALDYASANAQRNNVSERVTFSRYDLTQDFPEGAFDLIVASFLEAPMAFDRFAIFRRALSHVAPGGMLLITSHAKPPFWSAHASRPFQSAKEGFAQLGTLPAGWEMTFCDDVSRIMTGPDGQQGEVSDSVIVLTRKK